MRYENMKIILIISLIPDKEQLVYIYHSLDSPQRCLVCHFSAEIREQDMNRKIKATFIELIENYTSPVIKLRIFHIWDFFIENFISFYFRKMIVFEKNMSMWMSFIVFYNGRIYTLLYPYIFRNFLLRCFYKIWKPSFLNRRIHIRSKIWRHPDSFVMLIKSGNLVDSTFGVI